jgi:diguanylate cyclase (GGDEF)-like protein
MPGLPAFRARGSVRMTESSGASRDLLRELVRQNSILQTQQETMLDAILIVDENAKIVSYNQSFLEMWCIPEVLLNTREDDPVLQAIVAQIRDPERFSARVKWLYESHSEKSRQEIETRDGRTIDRFSAPVVAGDGEYLGRVWYFRDVTEARKADSDLRRMNRALQTVNSIHAAVSRGDSEAALLDRVSRLLSEQGQHRMVWIGIMEDETNLVVRCAAKAESGGGDPANPPPAWLERECNRGAIGMAARLGAVHVVRDIAVNTRMAAYRADALKRGYASAISLPLTTGGKTIGLLLIVSEKTGAFDEEETGLLQELAATLAFGIVANRSNIDRARAIARAERLSHFDAITDLPNRARLVLALQQAIDNAEPAGNSATVVSISVDRFSEIQHALGIGCTDALLKMVASRLQLIAGPEDFLAHIGSEVFALVIARGAVSDQREWSINVQRAMGGGFEYLGIPVDLHVTCGAASYPAHGADAESVVRRSDIAVIQAREAGVEYAIYCNTEEAEGPKRIAMLAELRGAIRDDGLRLHYQPKVDAHRGTICGVEALLRWKHSKHGMIPPSVFVPLAEKMGLISPITRWVVDVAARQINDWLHLGMAIPIAVNVSASDLRDPSLLDHLVDLKERTGLRLDLLQVEITETSLMTEADKSREALCRMRDMGLKVYIDDFGTGYSSLNYIAELLIDGLKLDRSLTKSVSKDARHRAVVAASISLAHDLGMRVVAEGIETEHEAEALRELGCDELQGYFFSLPLPADQCLLLCRGSHLMPPMARTMLSSRSALADYCQDEIIIPAHCPVKILPVPSQSPICGSYDSVNATTAVELEAKNTRLRPARFAA